MKVKSESEVAQLCPTLRDLMDCSPPGSSVHGIFQARVKEGGAIAFSIHRCKLVNPLLITQPLLLVNNGENLSSNIAKFFQLWAEGKGPCSIGI